MKWCFLRNIKNDKDNTGGCEATFSLKKGLHVCICIIQDGQLLCGIKNTRLRICELIEGDEGGREEGKKIKKYLLVLKKTL